MSIHTLLPRRVGAACLVALLGLSAFDSTPAAAYTWTKGQIARHERYLACKARITKDPPCNQNWTRYCARQCHALFW
jgi:hypothetical protein